MPEQSSVCAVDAWMERHRLRAICVHSGSQGFSELVPCRTLPQMPGPPQFMPAHLCGLSLAASPEFSKSSHHSGVWGPGQFCVMSERERETVACLTHSGLRPCCRSRIAPSDKRSSDGTSTLKTISSYKPRAKAVRHHRKSPWAEPQPASSLLAPGGMGRQKESSQVEGV